MSSQISRERWAGGWSARAGWATIYLLAAAATYGVAVWTDAGQRLDSQLMGIGFGPLTLGLPLEVLQVLRKGSLYLFAAVIAGEAVLALRRGLWGTVLRCGTLVALASGLATWLRRLLPRPDLGDPTYPFNTWPSGHVAATTSLFMVALILAPMRSPSSPFSTGASLLIAVAAGSSVATLAHRPSDVAGSILVVTALTVALFSIAPRRTEGVTRKWLVRIVLSIGTLFAILPGAWGLGFLANAAWCALLASTAVDLALRGRDAQPSDH